MHCSKELGASALIVSLFSYCTTAVHRIVIHTVTGVTAHSPTGKKQRLVTRGAHGARSAGGHENARRESIRPTRVAILLAAQ